MERVRNLELQLQDAQCELRKQLGVAAGLQAEMQRRDIVNEELRQVRLREKVGEVRRAEERAQAHVMAERAKVDREMRAAMLKVSLLERQIAGRVRL